MIFDVTIFTTEAALPTFFTVVERCGDAGAGSIKPYSFISVDRVTDLPYGFVSKSSEDPLEGKLTSLRRGHIRMDSSRSVRKAPQKEAFPERAKLVAAVIFLLLLCVGIFYLAAACIPLALLRDKFIHMADPATFGAFTPRYYQHLRVKVVLFGVAALFLAALQFRFRHPLTIGIGICSADGYRMVDGIRQRCREVSTAEWRLLSVITALAGIVRFHYLHQPMRYDEVTTFVSYPSRPFYVLLSVYAAPNNHVLHTILVRCSSLLFGNQDWALRLPTLVAGTCMVPLTYAVTRTLYGRGAAALATGLVDTSSTMIEYSTYARGYTLLCLFSLMLFWGRCFRGFLAVFSHFCDFGSERCFC